MTFGELGLHPSILSALAEQKYKNPSPIQEKAIPPALEGRDVLGCAQTGTGKTCAFATPILQRLEKPVPGRPVRALILTPTRELALQIYDNILGYGKNLPLKTAVIFGGVSQGPQVSKLKQGVDILVATPGRLNDLQQQKLLDLSKIEIFVLDEADRMLDMGFIHDVKKILTYLPKKKQTLFFSATMPTEITQLVDSLLVDPVKVAVNPVSSPVEVIQQQLYLIDKHNKSNLLCDIIKEQKIATALVFTRTKHGANKVAKDLEKSQITAAAIHGNKSQTARQQALAQFKEGKIQVLVATDIAARGIDIDKLSYVFNYNLPEVPETYVHRIGRTGRAGREGVAIAFCDFGEKSLLRDIESLMGKKIPLNVEHKYPMTVFEVPKKDKSGRIINSEDEEARAAARDRRRQRDEEAKARRRNAGSPQNATQKPPQGNQGNQSAQGSKSPKRGVRSGEVVKTGSSMPNTKFHRPNPLNEGEEIMDATARLLAPKHHNHPQKVHKGQSPSHAHHTSDQGEKSRSHAEEKPRRQSNRNQANHQNGDKKKQGQSHVTKQTRNKGQRNRRPRHGEFEDLPHTTMVKDSTEQRSLVKPFYLDF
ncbi:MAG: DEAD/DEAH box helicase [Eubacteriales bacterium]